MYAYGGAERDGPDPDEPHGVAKCERRRLWKLRDAPGREASGIAGGGGVWGAGHGGASPGATEVGAAARTDGLRPV